MPWNGGEDIRWTSWSERRRADEARELLAAAGGVLDRSLDPRQTARAIAEMAVPRLAEMCVIDLLDEDGMLGEAVAVAQSETSADRLRELRAMRRPDLNSEHPVARAVRSRQPIIANDLTDALTLEQFAPEPEFRMLLAAGGYRSAIVMPLIARERLVGVLSLLYSNGRRVLGHLALTQDLADRAATALDNANMYVARTRLAQTLQRSLLPETLPELDRLVLASAYHPVGEGNEVGGDFYDVFTTPFGCWLVVGDVCGKGAEAAAVTALVRHSIRAFAFVRSSPAQVLGAVNEVMLGHELLQRFATVVVARLDLTSEPIRTVIAGAGHPPPILLGEDGSSRCHPTQGTMLGVRSGSNVQDIEIEMERASTLVLYTDGLLDAGAPRRGLTSRELCDLLAPHAASRPQALVQRLERLALSSGAGRLRDDIAILAVRAGD